MQQNYWKSELILSPFGGCRIIQIELEGGSPNGIEEKGRVRD